MAKREPVELTDSAKRRAIKAGLLKGTGSGKVRKAGEAIVRGQSRANAALRAAQSTTRRNQTTDSNN